MVFAGITGKSSPGVVTRGQDMITKIKRLILFNFNQLYYVYFCLDLRCYHKI